MLGEAEQLLSRTIVSVDADFLEYVELAFPPPHKSDWEALQVYWINVH